MTSKDPFDVTISDLSLHPQKFNGRLVRVQGLLVIGWEGDNFMSDPNPQRASTAYVWLYGKREAWEEVYAVLAKAGHEGETDGPFAARRSIHGSFTGYFRFVPNHTDNRVFDPGPLQFEAIEVSLQDSQPRSLSQAIRDGDLEETRRIIRLKPNLNVTDEYQSLPLFQAIEGGYGEIVDELLAAGADSKLALPGGRDTALLHAAWNDRVTIARTLLNRGAAVNAANSLGETALIYASQTCPDGRMVQLLLDAGADPNAGGGAALRAAAGNPLVVEKLLAAGADPTFQDKDGNTVENESCDRGEKGHAQVCALIRHALAKK